MSETRLPDFIIIGAMKSATTSLQEQLVQQPGIFMCDPKEPNFFSDDHQYDRGIAWYTSMFSSAPPGALLGEASTHYTKLPTYPRCVARLHEHLPNVRLVYVMRHPVDRLVSHYIHEWTMGNINCSIDDAVNRHPEMIAYGKYAMQLAPFFEMYGPTAVLPVFFDRLLHQPQLELERVSRFIGYGNTPQWLDDRKPANVSSERLRKFPLFSLIVDTAPATWLRRTFVPQSLRSWVKTRLTMKHRPVLNEKMRSILESEFDRDLMQLGSWLGQSLDCQNFKQITGTRELNWIKHRG